jgi:hypothetical protein
MAVVRKGRFDLPEQAAAFHGALRRDALAEWMGGIVPSRKSEAHAPLATFRPHPLASVLPSAGELRAARKAGVKVPHRDATLTWALTRWLTACADVAGFRNADRDLALMLCAGGYAPKMPAGKARTSDAIRVVEKSVHSARKKHPRP